MYGPFIRPERLSLVISVSHFIGDELLQIDEQDAAEISAIFAELERSVDALQQYCIYDCVDTDKLLEPVAEVGEDSFIDIEKYILDSFKSVMTKAE